MLRRREQKPCKTIRFREEPGHGGSFVGWLTKNMCVYMNMWVHMYVCTCYMYVCICKPANVYMCMYLCVYVCASVWVYMCVHVYAHM